jgi:hypothetical protein
MTDSVLLEDVQLKLVKPIQPVLGTVVSNELCMNGKSASFVKHLAIDVSDTPLAGAFRSGQSVGVIPPGEDEHGKPHKVRLYSLACPSWGEAGKAEIISTTPKRLIDEYVSETSADDLDDHHLFLSIGILTGIFRQRVEYRNSAGCLLLREQSKRHCW